MSETNDVATPVLPLSRLKRWHACDAQYARIAKFYPDGVPLTLVTALMLDVRGIDVLWAATHLLRRPERRQFMLFTLRQRKAALVALLNAEGLTEQAQRVAQLTFTTVGPSWARDGHLDVLRQAAVLAQVTQTSVLLERARTAVQELHPFWDDAYYAAVDAVEAVPEEEKKPVWWAQVRWIAETLSKRGVVGESLEPATERRMLPTSPGSLGWCGPVSVYMPQVIPQPDTWLGIPDDSEGDAAMLESEHDGQGM